MGLFSGLLGLFSSSRGRHSQQAPRYAMDDGLADLRRFAAQSVHADAVVIDTETVGSGSNTQLIEIGAILLDNGNPFYEYDQLIDPRVEIPMSATLLSGIKPDDLAGQPTALAVIPTFANAIRNLTVIGHNVGYDINVVGSEMRRAGGEPIQFESLDTLDIARTMFPNAPSLTLQELIRLLGINAIEEHRAISDARWTLECWKLLDSMHSPVILAPQAQQQSHRRATVERQRKTALFMKSVYLSDSDMTPLNDRPEGTVIETVECGVEISGDEEHQDLLARYGYDAWLWVYVTEDTIRRGTNAGCPTYWVYLDGEEIGYISRYQMERHCGQIPDSGAVMLAHIPNRAKDIEAGRLQLRLQMPAQHDPIDLTDRITKPASSAKPKKKPEPKIVAETSAITTAKKDTSSSEYANAKPHKKVLQGTTCTQTIRPVDGLDEILADFEDGAHVWVVVRFDADLVTVRLQGTLIGTANMPSDVQACDGEPKVTSAVIRRVNGRTTVDADLPVGIDETESASR